MTYKRIKHPRNDQRSVSAWREIGYQVRAGEAAVGYCRVKHYGNEYDVWDSTQVDPMWGVRAESRREAYHEYLFRRRMWEKRFAVAKYFKLGMDEYIAWFDPHLHDDKLWSLGVLLCKPLDVSHLAAQVAVDCMSENYPKAPKKRKATDTDEFVWADGNPLQNED